MSLVWVTRDSKYIYKKENMMEHKKWNSSFSSLRRHQRTVRIPKIMKVTNDGSIREKRILCIVSGRKGTWLQRKSLFRCTLVYSAICVLWVGVTTVGSSSNEKVARPPNTPRGSPFPEIYWNFIFMVVEHGSSPPDGWWCPGARADDLLRKRRKKRAKRRARAVS